MPEPALGTLTRLVRDAALDALAVLFPVDCAGCGAADRTLCSGCRAELLAAPVKHVLADGTPIVSALRYEGVVRRILLAFKEEGRTDAARALVGPLRTAIEQAARRPGAIQEATIAPGAIPRAAIELCTIPGAARALRRRGYRPVDLLLRSAGFRSARALVRAAATAEQKSLGRGDRERNLHGSLRARGVLQGRRFLLVDDVLTTGATLGEAARAIRAGGGEVVAGATLAFTPRRNSHT